MAVVYDHLWIPKRTAKDWGKSEYRIIRNWTPREQRQQHQSEQAANWSSQGTNHLNPTTNQSHQLTNRSDRTTSRSNRRANQFDPHSDEEFHEKTISNRRDILEVIDEVEEKGLPHDITNKAIPSDSPLPSSPVTPSHLTPSHLTPSHLTPSCLAPRSSLKALQVQRSKGGERGGGGERWQEEEEEEMELEEEVEEEKEEEELKEEEEEEEEEKEEEEVEEEEEEEGRSVAAEKEAPKASSPARVHRSSPKRKRRRRQKQTGGTTSHKLWQSGYIERMGRDLHELDITFSLYDQAVREMIVEESCVAVKKALMKHWRLTKKEVMSAIRNISIVSALEKRRKKECTKHRRLQSETLSMLTNLRKSNGNFIKAAVTAKKTRKAQTLSIEQREIEEISRDILSFSSKLSS